MDTMPLISPDRLASFLDRPADRYACYPGVTRFSPTFENKRFLGAIATSNEELIPRRLSLHIAVPGIDQPGFSTTSGSTSLMGADCASAYLDRIVRELELIGRLFERDRDVIQVSLAPGFSSLFRPDDLRNLLDSASRHFHVFADARSDIMITLDPARCGAGELAAYAALGVNRAGFALQSPLIFNPATADPRRYIEACRTAGINSIRVDLVYGAPRQDQETVIAQLAAALQARPDRVGLRDCAHLPESFRQPLGTPRDIPEPIVRATTLLVCDRQLREAGYHHLGMDLYVREQDPLLLALARGQLHRDALGFGAHGETDLVGIGVGAISQVGETYVQAAAHLRRWAAAIDAGNRAIQCGAVLDNDDMARSEIIRTLLCSGALALKAFEQRHRLEFAVHFADDLVRLERFVEAGLVQIEPDTIRLTSSGKLVSRIVAACFDRYLPASGPS